MRGSNGGVILVCALMIERGGIREVVWFRGCIVVCVILGRRSSSTSFIGW